MSTLTAPNALKFQSVARTHLGHRRTVNEDRVLERSDTGLWAIADGMGGHRAGDVAATRLIEALAAMEHETSGYARLSEMLRRIEAVNTSLYAEQSGEGALSASGSTLVTLLAHDNHYACLWAGDSRAYLFRNGRLNTITRDHSVVQEMVDNGVLAEADRQRHPSANIVTRALGVSAVVDIEQKFAPMRDEDLYLLCSDGLSSGLDDSAIAGLLDPRDLAGSADRLLDGALAVDGTDNISLILIAAAASL
jgi:serine/threonine protein phosphatase PrpC